MIDEAINKYRSLHLGDDSCLSISVLLPSHWDILEGEKSAAARRTECLESGAMIGVLGPGCHLSSVKIDDRGYRPFQTPDNWLNVRTAVQEDVAFVGINPALYQILLKLLH